MSNRQRVCFSCHTHFHFFDLAVLVVDSQAELEGIVDDFGDLISEDLTPESLLRIFDNMTNVFKYPAQASKINPSYTPEIIRDIENVSKISWRTLLEVMDVADKEHLMEIQPSVT
jgi:hypothetical protein